MRERRTARDLGVRRAGWDPATSSVSSKAASKWRARVAMWSAVAKAEGEGGGPAVRRRERRKRWRALSEAVWAANRRRRSESRRGEARKRGGMRWRRAAMGWSLISLARSSMEVSAEAAKDEQKSRVNRSRTSGALRLMANASREEQGFWIIYLCKAPPLILGIYV